jgi:DNA-directed DNA polymerase III PolC
MQELKWKVAPISDTNSTFGFTKFTKLAKSAQLRPIYGVELNVATNVGHRHSVSDRWTFFAKSSLRPLHDLIGLATLNGDKEPALTYKQALAAKDLIKISGERVQIEEMGKPMKDFFIGLSPSLPKGLASAAAKRGFKFLAVSDNVYPRREDEEFYRITLGRRASTQTYPQWILSDAEWREACKYIADKPTLAAALRNRDAAMAQCKATMKKATLLKPKKPKTLRAMCVDGAKRTGVDLSTPVYKERLDRELALIEEKKFEDYFYVIADMVNWAKERMIVGPARGSSCGSLVCYLLNITTIDPIPYGLIFERFIDTTRTDLPDIDIDFSDQRRQMVFDYAEKKYGADHVARLGTVGMFKPRSALNAVGMALQIPRWQVEKVLDGVIERSSGDARAMLALEDTINETDAGRKMLAEFPEVKIAGRLEGHPNNASQHAAGIVITEEPVVEYVAVNKRTRSAMVDKKDAEELNLLKIDALGLTQLSIFERALQFVGKPDKSGYLETLPLDDPAAFEVLNKGHFAGIFQFTGAALQSLAKQVKIDKLEDMVAITALARPGPLATGGANSWVKRRNGAEEVSTVHPMLTELTKDTQGIVIYQETVMNIVREMGKFSWEDTSAIRKAMSGRLGDEFFERYRVNFLKGAATHGIDEDTADQVWRHINTMGSWAFNRSHAVAYGIVSYYCCWLKAHHPMEFAAATLDAEADPTKQLTLLRELKSEGIDYIAFDLEHSTERWAINGDKQLVGPLTSIKGIGPAAVMEILDARALGNPLREALAKRLATAKTSLDTLYPIRDRVKVLYPDLSTIIESSEPLSVIDVQCGNFGRWQNVIILAVVKRIAPRDENDSANVQKREQAGRRGRLSGPTQALNLFFQDDSDEIFCKVDRFRFEELGRAVIERGRPGKSLYAVRGTVPPDFRMISINSIKYLGDLEDEQQT